MDAIKLLKQDHRKVEALFAEFKLLDNFQAKERGQVVSQLVRALRLHAAIEERHFYPHARAATHEDEEVLEAYEEHHIIKYLVEELAYMDPHEERYAAKVGVLEEVVSNHVQEEERVLFPLMKQALDTSQLDELGKLLEAARLELQSVAERGLPRVTVTMLEHEERTRAHSRGREA